MKYILSLILLAALNVSAAPTLTLGLEPYASISWTGLDGESEIGGGVNGVVGITKNLSVVGFAEADDLDNTLVERFGAGLRYTAWLGSNVSLDAGGSVGHDLFNDVTFIRLPLGANLYAIKTKNANLGLRVSYAFDISGGTKHGVATGRGFAGVVAGLSF
jgi:hypothetical protein